MAFSGRTGVWRDFYMGLLEIMEVQGILQVTCQFIKTILHAVMGADNMQRRYTYTKQRPVQEILFAGYDMSKGGFAQLTTSGAMTGLEGNLTQRF